MKILLLIALLVSPCTAEWQQAPQNHVLTFPRDHGSHPDQKIEWWYFTGNLGTTSGHRLGYQLTFFRIGADAQPENPSAWTVRDLHMAHFAVSDLTSGNYHSAQKFERAGPGLAGADLGKLHAWNGTWRAEMNAENQILLEAESRTTATPFSLNLTLETARPIIPHGENGYSRKGQQPGNASIYYSLTRLISTGQIQIGTTTHRVTGLSWMDHEFGTSFLEPGQVGWDWFSLHLADGSDLMLFQIRNSDATAPANRSGTLISPSGEILHLQPGDFTLTSDSPWKSKATGASYPLRWQLQVPRAALALTVTTPLPAQEMLSPRAGPSYWEGSVTAEGTRLGNPIQATGYLEMTGYSGASMESFFNATDP